MMPDAPFDPLREAEESAADPSATAENNAPTDEQIASRRHYRGTSDLLFGFIIAAAVSIGFVPMLPASVELRYTLAWGALAGVSVLSWLLGSMERIEQEIPENLGWGILYGLMLCIPFLVFFGEQILGPAAAQLFPGMSAGGLLAFLVFVMPMSETLFFRGLLQEQLAFWLVGLLATLWNILLFFPVMWDSVAQFPAVTAVIGLLLLLTNLLYVYVRRRNGLAAAWITQIVANLILLYVPFL